MARRIWLAEGYASDGDVYGRVLRLPGTETDSESSNNGSLERKGAEILKYNYGDIPSCPCISAVMPESHNAEEADEVYDA